MTVALQLDRCVSSATRKCEWTFRDAELAFLFPKLKSFDFCYNKLPYGTGTAWQCILGFFYDRTVKVN